MKLKYWRQERSLSQFELSAASLIPRWKIQLMEQGIYAPSQIEREILTTVLAVSSEQIFGVQQI